MKSPKEHIDILKPTHLICNILWLELMMGVVCFSILQHQGSDTGNTVIIIMFILCILQIFTHCLSEIIPMGLESKIPCIKCNRSNGDGHNIFDDE
jgi:hypothetical protein